MEKQNTNSTPSVRRIFEDAKHLEQQIRNAPNTASNQGILRKSRLKLRDLYYSIITIDYEFSISKEIEMLLWKSCFYKPADDFRHGCKKAHRNLSRNVKHNNRAKEELARVCTNFKQFLDESSAFYHGMIKKFENTFNLNLQNPRIHGETSPIARQAYISCHRCYIYLGDLMRYHRDLHSDPTQKNWTQATTFYQHAIRLYPDSGHPHNQLAVMCTHKDFEFRTLYHYYRALFAKIPFPGTRENLTSLLERNRAKFENAETEEKNILENFLLCFVRLHGIAFTCAGEEDFPVVLPKALHLFEKLIQHGAIKSNLIWQLFIVNVATLHNAMEISEKEDSEVAATSIRLSLTLLISFFANLLYQYLVLPSEKISFYRNFYKPVALISSWLSVRSFFLSQPTDLAQRVLWSKLRELFSKVVTKILEEGLPLETPDSLAPTSEDIDFQGFLPLQHLVETHKIDFSLPQLSGEASDQRRREKIIQFAFFLCQTNWVGDETFIYFDRSTNSFTVEKPTSKNINQIVELNNQFREDDIESNNDPLFLNEELNFNVGNGEDEDEEEEEELDDVVLFRPNFKDQQEHKEDVNFFQYPQNNAWENGKDDNTKNWSSESDTQGYNTSPLRLVGLLPQKNSQTSPTIQSPAAQQDILGVVSPLNMGLYASSSNSFFPGIGTGNQSLGTEHSVDIFSPKTPLSSIGTNGISSDFGTIWNSPTMNSSSFFSQFSNPLTGLATGQVDELIYQTNSIDLNNNTNDDTDDAPPGLSMHRDDSSTSPLIGGPNLISRNKGFSFYDESLSSLTG